MFGLNQAERLRISDPVLANMVIDAAYVAATQHDPPIKQKDFLRAVQMAIWAAIHWQTRILVLNWNKHDIGEWEPPED